MADAEALRAFASDLADAADAITMPAFLAGVESTAKADGTPVTEADTAVEALIRSRIGERFPTHSMLGEEFGEQPGPRGADGTRWVMDPIDGTVNFARGIQVWATLIAVERDGELLAAVVSAPALGQRWSAAQGRGASTVRGGTERPMHVSNVDRLGDAHLVHAGLANLEADGRGAGVATALRRSARDRGIGDFWGYMLVAQGSADAMFEVGVKPWDLAAPALIVAEAGGRFTDLEGSPVRTGPSALATNGRLHEELVAILAQA